MVAGDFYLGVRGRSTAFGLDFSNGDDSRSFLWESCEGAWLAEDGINSNTSPGKRMFRVEGYALVPPRVEWIFPLRVLQGAGFALYLTSAWAWIRSSPWPLWALRTSASRCCSVVISFFLASS